MSDIQKSHLSLASSFDAADYIPISEIYEDPLDSNERTAILAGFRGAIALAGIRDYRIFDHHTEAVLHLKTDEDVQKYEIAKMPGESVIHEFIQFEPESSPRKLRYHVSRLQRFANDSGFADTIFFEGVPEDQTIIVQADSKRAYFRLCTLMEENGMLKRYAKLSYDEPDMAVPSPPEPETQEEHAALALLPAEPKTPKSRDHLTLVKSFDAADYPFPLTVSFVFDPAMKTSDRVQAHVAHDMVDYKASVGAPLVKAGIYRSMMGRDADDYYVIEYRDAIVAYFRHEEDRRRAYAEIKPLIPFDPDHPYMLTTAVDNLAQHDEALEIIQEALDVAGIQQYRLYEQSTEIEIRFATWDDKNRFKIAISPEPGVERHEFVQLASDYDVRKLKKHNRMLSEIAKGAGFNGSISFTLDRRERRIMISATDKEDYFHFCDVAQESGLIDSFARIHRRPPGFF